MPKLILEIAKTGLAVLQTGLEIFKPGFAMLQMKLAILKITFAQHMACIAKMGFVMPDIGLEIPKNQA